MSSNDIWCLTYLQHFVYDTAINRHSFVCGLEKVVLSCSVTVTLCSCVISNSTRRKGLVLCQGRVRLDIRK